MRHILCGILVFTPSHKGEVIVYARGTDEEISTAGVVLDTGCISDTGERKGHPLMFYLAGEDIASVRFSCKREQRCFSDWTEKRDEYGNAQSFTVAYGEEESEYSYLVIDWVPNVLIRELTDHADSTIATLPEEMRSDVIVMEITFGNGEKMTKAITVSLLEDGTFYAALEDYRISEADAFVRRPDSEGIPRDILCAQGSTPAAPWTAEQIEGAKQAALDYYRNTVFTVNTVEYTEEAAPYGDVEGGCSFTVNVSRGGVPQEPDRRITLQMEEGGWKVVNEGY